MDFSCPHCGSGSFTLLSDFYGSQFARCQTCDKTTPFEKQQMTTSDGELEEPRKVWAN